MGVVMRYGQVRSRVQVQVILAHFGDQVVRLKLLDGWEGEEQAQVLEE